MSHNFKTIIDRWKIPNPTYMFMTTAHQMDASLKSQVLNLC